MRSGWVRIALLALGATMTAGCACDAEDIARQYAGGDAIDCGRVSSGLSSEEQDRCAVAAMRAGQGFIVRQELNGIDSAVIEFYVRESGSGAMHRIVEDDGRPHLGYSVTEQACVDATIVMRDGFEQVTCTPSGPMHQVCSNY